RRHDSRPRERSPDSRTPVPVPTHHPGTRGAPSESLLDPREPGPADPSPATAHALLADEEPSPPRPELPRLLGSLRERVLPLHHVALDRLRESTPPLLEGAPLGAVPPHGLVDRRLPGVPHARGPRVPRGEHRVLPRLVHAGRRGDAHGAPRAPLDHA